MATSSVDLSNIWGNTSTPAPQSSSTDLSKIWGKGESIPPSVSPATQPPTSGGTDLSSIWGGGESRPNNGQPEAPTPAVQHLYQDSSQPWYKRGWDWLDTPLVDFNHLLGPEGAVGKAFGRTSEAGGFERGAENIVSGLTSPLSVALTAATFGTGGLVESAGMTALKESGQFAAEELPQIVKASEAAIKATKDLNPIEPAIRGTLQVGGHDLDLLDRARKVFAPLNRDADLGEEEGQAALSKVGLNQKQRIAWEENKMSPEERQALATANGGFSDAELNSLARTGKTVSSVESGFKPVEQAVRDAGVDPELWKRAQSYLYDNGLTEHDLLSGNMVERGAFQIIHNRVPDLSLAATVRAAKTANSLLNAGFTLQQLETASSMSPRFLDALKEGDYDKAWEYGTEAFAGGTLGVLGASHALHSAGELFQPLIETNKLRPNDEWLAIDRANKEKEALYAVAEQHGINIDKVRYEILGHQKPGILGLPKDVKARQDLELATVLHYVVTQGDKTKAADWNSILSEAAGRARESIGPNNGPVANPDVQKLAENYTASAGIDKTPHEGLVALDPEAAKRVADAYEAMKHDPNDPKVKASYDALIRETKAQWDAAIAAGYKLEPWEGPGQPYANSRELVEDVKNNKRVYYFQGGEVPEKHPLAGVDPATGETYNNIFRAVHDLFGHAKNGYEFGPRGEENAFLAHSRMYSDEAVPALLSETKGQNSWVNFGKHLRDENGNVPKRGEKGFIPKPDRPFADQKAGILPAEIVNPHLGKEPQVGTPIETPSRAGTQVVHSNDAGEVRVGADGRPVVWLSPEAWEAYNRIVHPGDKISGVSYSPEEAVDVAKDLLKANEPGDAQKVLDLFWKAQETSKQNLLTTAKTGTDVTVAAEELQHTHQRELAKDGEIRNLFSPRQWSRLSGIIPPAWSADMDRLGYDKDPITRVAETAAQFRAGKARGIVPDTDITRFLDSYYTELESKYGKDALESADRINEIAAQHIKDIYENRRTRPIVTEGGVADQETGNGQLPRVEEGRKAGPPKVGSGEPQDGLASREEDEFNKLGRLKLRVGMGDPNSAGLVTGDNDVLIGRDHAELIREAGYKATPASGNKTGQDIYAKFFNDGGVRIRTAGGVAHVDFMEPNADTWDRVYRSIASMPEANKYYVDFRPIKGGTGFNISAYDKDDLLYKLKNLEEGRERPPAPAGSVSYFRQGLFSREGDSRPSGEARFPGLASRGSVDFEDIKPYLSDEELSKHDTPEKKDMLTAAFNAMPDSAEWREAIKAGRAGQMWYERSSRAFDALLDSGADFISKKDKSKFLNFVAALSPVQPVRSNLLMALNLWSKWDKAGRPADVEWKDGVPNKNASLYRILKGRGNTQGVDLPARMNNAIRALQGEPLSGPKVSAFTTNLGKDVNRVTNDTWMAVFGGHDPNRINKPQIYDAMSAKVRQAAEATGIAPRQAQAAIWSFIKSLAELSGWGNDRWIPPQEIIKQGLLTPELVGMHSADFADMLQNDPEIRDAIKNIGGDLNALDRKLKTYVPGKPTEGEAAGASPELLNAAERLETARRDSRIAGHLARKQEPGLFDTEFRPNNGLFSRQDPELAHQIETNVFKNQPKEYQDLILNSLRRVANGELSDREQAAAKYLRDEQDRNFEIGSSNDLLHHYLEDYMTRVYKDTNPQGRVILSDAKGGRFATNVSMAKQRVYDSNLTALLKSPKQMLLDPVDITARGRAMLIKAAANRQLIDTLRDKFTRASDGRPAVVLSGSGQVVAGANGEDPKTFIDPNRVRKINIDPKVVDQLSKSGDLQRFLDEGTIRDITPYVHPQNIGAAIDRLQEETTRKNPQYDAVGNNKLTTQIMYLKSMLANKDFSGLKEFNDALEKKYAWDPQDYISLANGAMKGWNFVTNSPDGSPVYVRSDIRVHPEFAEYLKNRLGLEPSDISKHPVGKALLGVGTKAKETLLSLSPFHTVQIALRGLMTGINPFTLNGPDILDGAKVDPSDPNSPTKLRKMVEHGYTTGTDYKALQEHSEGLSGGNSLIRKIPGVGPVLANSLDFYNNFLFKRFIPAVKATAAEHLFDEYRNAHPDWSVDRIAKAAALHSNENFGGINWRAMGRSATTQDWGRLMLLAPDWLESELRAGARLFNKDEGGIGRRQVAIMTMALWGIARTLNLMNSGNMHVEAPFGLVTKSKDGKEIIYSVRTLPEDLLHAATQPVQFLKGRLSPGIRTGTELVTGRDSFGRKLQPTDLWADVTRNLLPIPVQSIGQALTNTGPEVGNAGQFVKAIGGTAQSYSSPAEKLAADLAANHTEDGPIDPSQMARHRTILQFEDKLRSGEMSLPQIYKMYAAGDLHEDDLKKITENAKKTKDLSAPLASLYSRASRLPGPEYLQLYDQMNNSERAALAPLTLQVRKRYIAKAMKNLRPEERLHDPTFMRFLNMVTDQSPF